MKRAQPEKVSPPALQGDGFANGLDNVYRSKQSRLEVVIVQCAHDRPK
jgi:hypothetical protein